ncbi:hypothetical protein ACO2I3_04055 [Leptospira interrogans]
MSFSFDEMGSVIDLDAIAEKKARALQEFEENETGIRKVTIEGQNFEIRRVRGGFNLYTVHTAKGPVPKAFEGQHFTSFKMAEEAIRNYMRDHLKECSDNPKF